MRTLGIFLLSVSGIGLVLFGVSSLVGSSVFADISFDNQSEDQWYNDDNGTGTVSAFPEAAPIPIGITVDITRTFHSH